MGKEGQPDFVRKQQKARGRKWYLLNMNKINTKTYKFLLWFSPFSQ